jgi:hypothetical protein
MAFELFHAISDAGSARVRKFVVEHEFTAEVKFRNITYEEVVTDLKVRGGNAAPALWDGVRLFEGASAIEARLLASRDVGRHETK